MRDSAIRKTSRDYWDGLWRRQIRVERIDPGDPRAMRQFDRDFHAAVLSSLARWGEHANDLIELGCGGSPYLPYFARYHRLAVTGLDYSPAGCALARATLQERKVAGDIVQGDMFAPPGHLVGRFDIVFSIGLLEHFSDTAEGVAAARRFLRPGGLMLSFVPNMTGLPGWLQRRLDREVYDTHVPLDAAKLAAAHATAGLEVLASEYLMTISLYVLRYRNEASVTGLVLRALRAGLMRALWWEERVTGLSFPNALTSPYILCAARLPA